MDKHIFGNLVKRGIIAVLILTLAAAPVFGIDGAAGQASGEQTKRQEEKKTVQQQGNEEADSEQKPADADINMDDPENNKYYTYDKDGNLIEKQSAALYSVSAVSGEGYVHPEKYADRTIYHCIDISEHQSNIDWAKVRADGITHAIIRVAFRGQSSGGLFEDSDYQKNIQEAYAAGIKVGVYIYSQAITEAEGRAEADYIMNCISPYQSMITMPVVFDYEFGLSKSQGGRFYAGRLSRAKMTKICTAFCEQVKAAGYEPMVYANANMLKNYLDRDSLSSMYKIWLAHYTTSTDYAGEFYMWQYTSSGSVDGISSRVDMNFIYESDHSTWVLDEAAGQYRFLKSDGVTYAASEWITHDGKKYYVDANGYRVTGYHKIGDYYYGFDANGVMLTGSRQMNGKQYKFLNNGKAYLYSAQLKKAAKYRTGPGKKYKQAGKYKKWKVVNIIREKNGWGMMKNGYWVKLSYTKKVTRYPHTIKSTYKAQTKTALNYRTGPGKNYKTKGTYQKWKVVNITKEKNGWGRMKNGYWVKLSYIKKV